MRVFKTRDFVKFARRAKLTDVALRISRSVAVSLRRAGGFPEWFAKNDRDNIDAVELRVLRRPAAQLLTYDETAIEAALSCGALTEVEGDGEAL